MVHAAESTRQGPGTAAGYATPLTPAAPPALTRCEVLHETLGGRTWLGALTNPGEGVCADVAVRLRFVDGAGRAVGAPVSARTDWLEPGAGLHLQARLPVGAAALQIVSLRWSAGGRDFELAPGGVLALDAAHA